MLGNVQHAIIGNLYAVGTKHISRYPAEDEYRFNPRFHLPLMIERFVYVALRIAPMPYHLLSMAESYT